MRYSLILIPLLAGCATSRPVATPSPAPVVIDAASATRFVETRYDVRGYREAENPQLRHEAHAVYRRTVVSAHSSESVEVVPRTTYAPASMLPLPASEELAAELATQRTITENMRKMQASAVLTEQKMQEQYAQLVRQTGEVMNLREKLEAERARPVALATPSTAPQGVENPSELKW